MSKNKIEQELIDRELSTRLLSSFTSYTKEDYQMIAEQGGKLIHPQIIEKLEAVEKGYIKRLMIFILPRIGKSELVSTRFPSWCLGKNPARKIIISSYGADLASDFGRKAKQVVESNEYQNIFPDFKLAKDKREGGNWETSEGGGLYTVGVGGATTGKGYDIGIIDDPVKDRQEAESETTQQRVIDWYTSTFYTRRQSQNSAIILMMTRWNVNDLAGYLLKEEKNGGDKWDVLVIPAIDEQGNEIIWKGKWDEGYLENVKSNISKKDWSALYQQDPIASSSNIFDLHSLRYFNLSDFEKYDGILQKEDLEISIFIDPAHSSNKNSDDAVITAIGRHRLTGEYYMLELYADTSAPSKTYMALLSMIDRLSVQGFNQISTIFVEDVPLNKLQTQFIVGLKEFLSSKGRYYIINPYKPKIKKEDRIKFNLEPVISMNKLNIRRDILENTLINKLENQLRDFPNGKHDDIIDAISQGIEVMDKLRQPNKQPKVATRRTDDYG